MDEGTNGPSTADRTPEEASFDRAVRIRLAHYGPNPSPEIISRVMDAVDANLRRQSFAAAAPVLASPVEKRKVQFAAFKSFIETEGEIDGYLADFERQCALHKVPAEDWVTILSGKLSGRASDAFRAIPDEEIGDYVAVKEALLSRYAVTPEAYRRRFRDTAKLTGDSYVEWACKVHRTAAHWMAGCQAVSGEEVLQMFLLEHCFEKLSPGVREWVRDRKPSTLHEAARLADEYTDARKLDSAIVKTPARVEYRPAAPPPANNYPQPPRPNSRDYSTPIRCFRCKQLGHKRPECPLNTANQAQSWRRPTSGNQRNPPPAAHCVEEEECWGVLHVADPVQAAHRDTPERYGREPDRGGCSSWMGGGGAKEADTAGATIPTRTRRADRARDRRMSTKHVTCRYFMHGVCREGSRCMFSHDLATSKPSTICRFYQKGQCAYGTRCRYDHVKPCGGGAVYYSQEPPSPSERRFGILSNCNHTYCSTCIRQW